MRTVTVAAVQCRSENGRPAENLARAGRFVDEAAERGAALVLCPEFLATGYIYDRSIWDAAEPKDGPTETWLRDLAKRHSIFVGASYLEAEGDDFFNTFTLAAPGGEVAGRVRKMSLPAFEGWFFKPCTRPKIIETSLGKLGVGICNDTQMGVFLRQMFETEPDLILMPHSAPTPRIPIVDRVMDDMVSDNAHRYAVALGVPTVLANKVLGPTSTPVPGIPKLRIPWRFRGFSTVCDANGTVLDKLVDREGVVLGDVTLGGRDARPARPAGESYWAFPPDGVRPRRRLAVADPGSPWAPGVRRKAAAGASGTASELRGGPQCLTRGDGCQVDRAAGATGSCAVGRRAHFRCGAFAAALVLGGRGGRLLAAGRSAGPPTPRSGARCRWPHLRGRHAGLRRLPRGSDDPVPGLGGARRASSRSPAWSAASLCR